MKLPNERKGLSWLMVLGYSRHSGEGMTTGATGPLLPNPENSGTYVQNVSSYLS